MTKTEFKSAAEKAGVNPTLYGAVLSGCLYSKDNGPVSGGKVAGIVWMDAWKAEEQYSPMRGNYTETFLAPVPYIVLKKGRYLYHVDVPQVKIYLDEIFQTWLTERIKSGEPL